MTPSDSPAVSPLPTAPRRARPLTPVPSPDPQAVAAALAIARSKPAARAAAKPPPASKAQRDIEAKIAAAGYDAEQILRTLGTEMALRRAGRTLKGDDQIKALRVLSVAMLFTLLIAALGAMSYMQTQLAGHGFKHHAVNANASPTPGPSAPAVDPDRQSAPPTR